VITVDHRSTASATPMHDRFVYTFFARRFSRAAIGLADPTRGERRMNAFEALIALLLRRQGYWVQTSFKVKLTKAEKRRIGRPSSPRWELDLVAYIKEQATKSSPSSASPTWIRRACCSAKASSNRLNATSCSRIRSFAASCCDAWRSSSRVPVPAPRIPRSDSALRLAT